MSVRKVKRGGGPRSVEGKAVVRLNAVRHGLTADTVALADSDDPGAWEAFRTALLDDTCPVGALETALAERAASLLWRLRRVAPYEDEVVAVGIGRVEEDFRRRYAFGPRPDSLREARANLDEARRCARLLEELPGMPPGHLLDHEDALLVLDSAASLFDEGPPDALGDEPGWTGVLLLHVLGELASEHGLTFERLYKRNLLAVAELIERRAADLAYVEDEQDRMRRERRLPPVETLDHIARYEAHLNRQLYHALHELEALRARREGTASPLARVQVHG